MTHPAHRTVVPRPRDDEVIQEIRYFLAEIRAARDRDPQAAGAALQAYAPFLARRLRLLSALRAGQAEAWRDHPLPRRQPMNRRREYDCEREATTEDRT